jgi:hypothetical protein
MNVKDQKQREAAQMLVPRPLVGLTRRHKQSNVDIRIKLNQGNIVDEFRNYQQNCLRHVNKMENKHISEVALQYQPHGKREIGRPRIRWSEQDHLKANELRTTGPTAIKLQRS